MPLYQVNAGDRILAADLNQFFQILKGVAASGETVTLIYNNEALIFQPSSDPVAGTRTWTVKNNAGTVLASMRYDGLLALLSAAAAPATAVVGSVYFDSLISALRVYDGTIWKNSGEDAPSRSRFIFNGLMTPSEITLVGTGTTSIPAGGTYRRFSTGATTAGSAAVRQIIRNTANFSVGVLRRLEFVLDFVTIDANTTAYFFVTTENAVAAPSLTANHIGVKQIAGAISFTTADGATEQTTVITSFITATRDQTYVVLSDGTTVRLFIDGTLRATHATNVPVSTMNAAVYWRTYIVTAANADKLLDLHSIDASFATS